MPDSLFSSVLTETMDAGTFLLCTVVSLVLGAGIAGAFLFKNRCTGSFAVTLALLPVIVQSVIMMVNGNIGTGVAVMGAFSLVRFRSAPGTAKEICSIFLSMAVGLSTGMGYLGTAALITIVVCGMSMLYTALRFGEPSGDRKELRVTIPESLDYNGFLDDVFEKYTQKTNLVRVKTTNMGSLYQLSYEVVLKERGKEKEMIDEIRCRNGNLDIILARMGGDREEVL